MRTGLAIGSNLGDRFVNLQTALTALRKLPEVSGPFLLSPIYETQPVGTAPDAGSFLNAVAEFEYHGSPHFLLEALQAIEAEMGRPSKRPRNASRTIDLDILYVGNLVLANDEIVIPHPRIHLRRFVLQPLAEIRPDLLLPGQQRTIRELLAALNDDATVELAGHSW